MTSNVAAEPHELAVVRIQHGVWHQTDFLTWRQHKGKNRQNATDKGLGCLSESELPSLGCGHRVESEIILQVQTLQTHHVELQGFLAYGDDCSGRCAFQGLKGFGLGPFGHDCSGPRLGQPSFTLRDWKALAGSTWDIIEDEFSWAALGAVLPGASSRLWT